MNKVSHSRMPKWVLGVWLSNALFLLFVASELGWVFISEVQAQETAPAPVVEEPKQEDELRARFRRRLEEGPPREPSSIESIAASNDDEVKTLYEKLLAQQRELEEKNQALARKEQSLVEREALVKNQLARYEETLATLRAEVNSLRGLKNTKLEEFRKVYSKMEPKKAARILDDMDIDLAGQIISSLKEAQAAEILGTMDPERARRITARFLTGRSFSQ